MFRLGHYFFFNLCILVQHWACVWSRSPAPQTRPPPSLYPSVRLGPPAAVSFPARFHYRDGCESVQIGAPVAPEQRSGGRQPPRTRSLLTATPPAHKTGKSQDVCAHRQRCRTGAGPGEWKAAVAVGLAKEVKLTSLNIFRSCHLIGIVPREKVMHRMSHDMRPDPVPYGYF